MSVCMYVSVYVCSSRIVKRSKLELLVLRLRVAGESHQHSSQVSIRQHTSAYVSIRQHTSAYVSIRQHTSAYVSIRQHTSAYVWTHTLA